MKIVSYAAVFSVLLSGCSGVSTVERGRFTATASRQEYCRENPDSRYLEYIGNGEIIRGMNGHEVIGSWGMPNVLLVSKDRSQKYWIYYAQNAESSSVMVFRLTFDTENVLVDWDVDMKRYANFSLVKSDATGAESGEQARRPISLEKR